MPPVDLPTRKSLPILGTLSPDIIRRDRNRAAEEKKLVQEAEKLMRELEEKGYGDRFADMQQRSAPVIDKNLVGKRIEVLCEYYEEDGTPFFCWAKGVVEAIPSKERKSSSKGKTKKGKKEAANQFAIVKWDEEYCESGGTDTTKQKLIKSKWNKHSPGAWRFVLESKI